MDNRARPAQPPIVWEQLSLLPHDVVEMTLQVGIVSETDHLQWQLTVRDPSAGTLLGMMSCPHIPATSWHHAYADICQALTAAVEAFTSPF